METFKSLIVGCPTNNRSWIIDKWFDHVEAACEKAEINCTYSFVVGNKSDDLDFISKNEKATIRVIEEHSREDVRFWNHSRYEYMSSLRNQLLSLVREQKPDLFLSLDSDILLHPDAIASAIDALQQHPDAWACGMKCYMSVGGTVHPSMGNWIDMESSRYYRADSGSISTVDIIMAAKLMKPEAYNIDYQWHGSGEDLGWSRAAKMSGAKFIWDGRVINKHVMGTQFLEPVDKRVGF